MIGVLILAGGKGQRMGGQDKGWCSKNKESFIETVLRQFQQQAEQLKPLEIIIVISANRNIADYSGLGYPVISDIRPGYCGPLAGVEAAMHESSLSNVTRWIMWPVDSLKVPDDYLSKMSEPIQEVCFLKQQQRSHYAHLSIPNTLKDSLSSYLDAQKFSIKGWLESLSKKESNVTEIEFPEQAPILNCNQTFIRGNKA